MSRVIKFRAWNPRISKMSQNTITIETLAEAGCKVQVDGLVWLQFTGLTDCNGVEIYEGDIIQTPYDFNVPEYSDYEGSTIGLYRGAVYFRPSAGFIQNRVVKQEHDSDCHQKWRPHKILSRIVQSKCEVIGNIYEHAHLLNHSSESP